MSQSNSVLLTSQKCHSRHPSHPLPKIARDKTIYFDIIPKLRWWNYIHAITGRILIFRIFKHFRFSRFSHRVLNIKRKCYLFSSTITIFNVCVYDAVYIHYFLQDWLPARIGWVRSTSEDLYEPICQNCWRFITDFWHFYRKITQNHLKKKSSKILKHPKHVFLLCLQPPQNIF